MPGSVGNQLFSSFRKGHFHWIVKYTHTHTGSLTSSAHSWFSGFCLLFLQDGGDTGANVQSWFQFDLEAVLNTGNQISPWQLQAAVRAHARTHCLDDCTLRSKRLKGNNLLRNDGLMFILLFSGVSLTFAVMIQNILTLFALFSARYDLKHCQSKLND